MRLACALALAVAGCAHEGGVTRLDPDTTVDVSGHWNDADANRVAAKMIADCLGSGWPEKFAEAHGGARPVVRFYPIRNRSDEHLHPSFFTKQVEEALLRSGRVRLVQNPIEAADNRWERVEQGWFASPATRKGEPLEAGADYVLDGWVVSQNDEGEVAAVRAYVVTMELSDVATNEKVWIGVERLKKLVQYAD